MNQKKIKKQVPGAEMVLGTDRRKMTDEKIISYLCEEFSKHYQIAPEKIEQAFQLAKEELGDSMNAYAALQTLLVNMLRDETKPIWKISKQTDKAMRKILSE